MYMTYVLTPLEIEDTMLSLMVTWMVLIGCCSILGEEECPCLEQKKGSFLIRPERFRLIVHHGGILSKSKHLPTNTQNCIFELHFSSVGNFVLQTVSGKSNTKYRPK